MAKGTMYIVHPDGKMTAEHFPRKIKLEELQKAVGGYIEAVPIDTFKGAPAVAYINEEGKLDGLPRNQAATDLVEAARPGFKYIDYIVGPMVILVGSKGFLNG